MDSTNMYLLRGTEGKPPGITIVAICVVVCSILFSIRVYTRVYLIGRFAIEDCKYF